jgi:acetolactate synthase I/II/III large subunit
MSSVAARIVAHLREAGVRAIFGVPGGGSNLDLIEAAGHAGLRFVLTATETAGAIAAIAQSELANAPGACLTGLGPGAASVVNGVACAFLDRAPLLAITDAPASSNGAFEHQRLDQRALLAPVTKWSATIAADDVDDAMSRAIACAMEPPRGPVHIECPSDISALNVARPFQGRGSGGSETPAPQRRPGDLKRVAAHLPQASRPVLLAGLGARTAETSAAIRSFCASHHVPAMVTYKAKGVVSDRDVWFAGVFTNGALERGIIDRADLLIVVGLDRVELLPRPWTFPQPVVDVADGDSLRELAGRLTRSDWDPEALQRAIEAQRHRLQPRSEQLTANRVVRIASDAAPGARVTVDAGAHMFPATVLWPVTEPNGMLISNGLSTMGFALPAAVGAALVDRERTVIALTGDGGLLMCAGELLTLVRERLRVIVIVFNDNALSLIDVKQRQRQFASAGVSLGDVAWASIAESFRMSGYVATTDEEFERAIASALAHRGPSLIDARIDPAAYADMLRAIRG